MSDIKLFRLAANTAVEIKGTASDLEKTLQTLIESNLESLLGIRFLASEHSTGKTHAGRIDTLGIDENNRPVIIEYKRSIGENVINQGLFYRNWLMDHQAEFKLLTLDKFGKATADAIDWTSPRLICIAADFTKYDAHAILEIGGSIELIRYRRFGDDLLLFELVNAVTADPATNTRVKKVKAPGKQISASEVRPSWLPKLSPNLKTIFDSAKSFIESLGDDVQQTNLKHYVAFKRLRNFTTVVAFQKSVVIYVHLNPEKVSLQPGFTRDVRGLGHWGTGELEIVITTLDHLEKAKPLIAQSYAAS